MNEKILLSPVRESAEYKALFSRLQELMDNYRLGDERLPLLINGASSGSELALILSLIKDIRRICKAPLLILVPEERRANRINDLFKKSGVSCEFYPVRDFNFYDMTASHEVEHERLRILSALANLTLDAVVTTPDALLQYTIPKSELMGRSFGVSVNDTVDIESLIKRLLDTGYTACELVESAGQFAVRGGIVDIFPTGGASATADGKRVEESLPVRIELFGDEVDRMGLFDPLTQRMGIKIDSFSLSPSKEIIPSELDEMKIRDCVAELYEHATNPESRKELQKELFALNTRTSSAFFDKFISLVYPERCTLTDYICDDSVVIACDIAGVRGKLRSAIEIMNDISTALVLTGLVNEEYADYMAGESELEDLLKTRQLITVDKFQISYRGNAGGVYDLKSRGLSSDDVSLNTVIDQLRYYCDEGYRCCVVCKTDAEVRETVKTICECGISAYALKDKTQALTMGAVCVLCDIFPEGYEMPSSKSSVIVLSSKTERSALRAKKRAKYAKNAGERILSYADLNVGDYVVHAKYGIGKFTGIENLLVCGAYRDYITIQYAGTDRLFLPVDQLDMVSKYIGASSGDGEVKLSKMGGEQWKRATARAKESAREMAKELIDLYARRMRIQGFAFAPDSNLENDFDSSFEFEETDSQLEAIEDIKRDMESAHPMDRVLCGDVGYGKTEVAFRASMKAVANGKQVAILVPTTILAMQHYQTALSRFAGTGVNIEMISRFRKPSEQARIIRALKRGDIDIIIGTHKLLGKGVEFKDLGLLVIDEEQRFGVEQKEKIKALVPNVDVLSLSATPIPRTLSMAMGGIRDMSVLDDAPGGRLGVMSYVLEYDENIINDAIRRELHRGGQVFYLYNNIETIYDIRARLLKSFPDARIRVAHGQMDRDEIEDIWQDLVRGEIDILVSTTIIETGIDIPNANTLIIENADKMGLSQLHQIRGRVGRSHRRAYAFFTYRAGKVLTEVAEKRLNAIRDFAEFGAGFKIAMRDLEIRGAGNLLGSAQHGHMEAIGYDLYVRILNEAVLEEKGEALPEKFETTISLSKDAFLPKEYIKYSSQRMDMYKKIAHIDNENDFRDIVGELTDRYGKMPRPAVTLVNTALVKAYAQRAKIKRLEQMREEIRLYPDKIDKVVLYQMSLVDPANIRICGIKTLTPYISLKTKPNDDELTGCVELLKIYMQKCKDFQ
ncbi:MAG: transcription-repair coupling factor [Clostridia bacterium]|nr:transcription-repair coupling factor [Clostridia bacterium]